MRTFLTTTGILPMNDEVIYSLYLICLEGHEDKSSIVVATSSQEARDKVLRHPKIKGLGAELTVRDISRQIHNLGFDIDISKKGLYH